MRPRIQIARLMIRMGRFIQSAAVAVMRPADLVEFSRRHYFRPESVRGWGDDQLINSGLSPLEQSLLGKIPVRQGHLLLLGVGGGREAIPLAKLGFAVTGVDFIPGMVEQALKNAEKNGLKIFGLIQEISKLDLPVESFSIAWLSAAMYSCVPTRKRRVDMLKRIARTLIPGGYLALGFRWNPGADASSRMVFMKKMTAWLSLGNLRCEKGDGLRFDVEFIHTFTDLDELKGEIAEGGFEMLDIQAADESEFAGAVARKPV
jgi:SAM-dependent methyltransferase